MGVDNSNRRCFGARRKLFRESGDFSGNRNTWKFSGKHAIIPGHCRKKSGRGRKFYFTFLFKIREDDPNFRDDLRPKQCLLELSTPVKLGACRNSTELGANNLEGFIFHIKLHPPLFSMTETEPITQNYWVINNRSQTFSISGCHPHPDISFPSALLPCSQNEAKIGDRREWHGRLWHRILLFIVCIIPR